MQTAIQLAAPIGITTGGTAMLFIVNPYVFYLIAFLVAVTCIAVCYQIIVNCDKRNKRLDALATRATRRRHDCGDSNTSR